MALRPEREPFPSFIAPMLLSSGPLPAADAGEWTYELKWDGMRVQVAAADGSLRLRSRARRDWTDEFPEIHGLVAALGRRRVILDGELVCLGEDGKPDFGRLRSRLVTRRPRADTARVRLMVFDVLHLDGRAVRQLPYRERRELLAEFALDAPAWSTPRTFDDGPALARVVAEQQLEGIVAKRLDRAYVSGWRSTTWVKHKHRRRTTCVVTGVAPARDGRPEEFLVARIDEDAGLRPAGRVGFGLSGLERRRLLDALAELRLPGRAGRGGVQWVAPAVAVDVEYHGSSNLLRDPILRAWRPLELPGEVKPGISRAAR